MTESTHRAPRATRASTLFVSMSSALLYSFMASTWRPCLKWSTPARTLKDQIQMKIKDVGQRRLKRSLCDQRGDVPLQGPGRRLLLPDCRGKVLLFEEFTTQTDDVASETHRVRDGGHRLLPLQPSHHRWRMDVAHSHLLQKVVHHRGVVVTMTTPQQRPVLLIAVTGNTNATTEKTRF